MAKSSKRPLAVFLTKNFRKIGDFILKVQTIVLAIGNNAGIFTTPSPTLASVTTNIDTLEGAEALAQTRVAGSAAARNIKYDLVLDDVYGLQRYVQSLADAAANEAQAIAIITASGFSLKLNGVHVKPDLAVKNGPVSGSVSLVAKAAGKRVSYNWQQSLNNMVTWTDLSTTLQARLTTNGLNPGAKAFFRVRPVTKPGPGNWSQPVSIIVQ